MKVDKNGVIIDSFKTTSNSIMGGDFVVMWDDDGLPIHIKRDIVDRMYNFIHSVPEVAPTNINNSFL